MGTRGFKAWRFRKRYYIQYNSHDSDPSRLGKRVTDQIPKDREKYLAWLKTERQKLEEWEATWDRSLVVRIDNELLYDGSGIYPSWITPLNGLFIEWVYILDLDREIFSVNNGAHFKLDRVPHVHWADALADGALGDKITLPSLMPKEAIANLVASPPIPSPATHGICFRGWNIDTSVAPELNAVARELMEDYNLTGLEAHNAKKQNIVRPACRIVTPKNMAHFAWRRRHGPGLRWMLFSIWSQNMDQTLAVALLQWSTRDLPFREIAFAALCIASGGQNVAVLPADQHKQERRKLNDLTALADQPPEESVSISHVVTGTYAEGSSPGSSPEEVIYWLEDVLVMLASQLYRLQAVDEWVAFIARYCQINYPQATIDAVLMSIEHVVLVHINPPDIIQRTALLPLFDIPNHLSMDVRDRYSGPYLDKLGDHRSKRIERRQARRLRHAEMRKDNLTVNYYSDSDDEEDEEISSNDPALHASQIGVTGDVQTTFFALTHIFDAAARRRMPVVKAAATARLPNEMLGEILSYVTDYETRSNCMKVSRAFRELCQEHVLLTENMILEPCEAGKSFEDPRGLENGWTLCDIEFGRTSTVNFVWPGVDGRRDYKDRRTDYGYRMKEEPFWLVGIGTGRNKSILKGVKFKLRRLAQ
ncbi:MAG: hypothetical protein Q9188_006502 [Gyalolechia gomerana]